MFVRVQLSISGHLIRFTLSIKGVKWKVAVNWGKIGLFFNVNKNNDFHFTQLNIYIFYSLCITLSKLKYVRYLYINI